MYSEIQKLKNKIEQLENEKKVLEVNQLKDESFFKNAPVGIFYYTKNGIISTFNSKFVEIIGSSEEILLGFNMLLSLQNKELLFAVKESLQTGEGNFIGVYESITSNKKTPARILFKGIRNKQNKIISGIGIVEDITEEFNAKIALKSSKQLLNETQALTKVGGWRWDTQTLEIFWTDEVSQIHGIDIENTPKDSQEHINTSIECYMPKDRDRIMQLFTDCYQKGISYEEDFEFIDFNKQHKWIRTGAKPVYKNGKIIMLLGHIMDIPKEKQKENELKLAKEKAEESSANIAAIIENTTSSVWVINRNYELTYINNLFKNEFLISSGTELKVGMNLLEALPEFLRPIWQPRYDRALNNERFVLEDEIPAGDLTIYIEVSVNPIIADGKVIGASFFGSNISERKYFEKELIDAREKAEESDYLKSTFLKNISHEIRTPMNAIIGFSNILAYNELEEDKRIEFTVIMQNATDKLLLQIENILTISHLETGQIKLVNTEFHLTRLLHALEDKIVQKQQDIKKTNIKISIVQTKIPDIKLIAGFSRLEEVFNILIDNALKFTKKGEIKLLTKITNETIDFIVEDTGIGFPEDKKEIAFKTFSQTSEKSRVLYGGIGLGLSICNELVNLMNGKILIKSELNKYTKICVSLPKSIIASCNN